MAVMSGMLKPLKIGFGQNATTEEPEATLARGTMIIMQGMEIGVPPMQAVQLLAMINGRISAHSEAVPGILWSKGFKVRQWFTGTEMADDWTAHCELTRPSGELIERSFSVRDAKKAGLWDQSSTKPGFRDGPPKPNDSAWFRYPQRMLSARALGFAGKDGGADALRGIIVSEEANDMEAPLRDVTPPKAAISTLELPDIPDEPQEPAHDQSSVLRELERKLDGCADVAAVEAVEREFASVLVSLDEAGRETAIEMIQEAKGFSAAAE
jgi:hypothetical protein